MDIRPVFAVEVRAEGSDKTLIRIDGLNEAEGDKVFNNIQFPTRSTGYDKLIIFRNSSGEDMVLHRTPLSKAK